ncbi:putative metal-dependent hydrolase [Lysinibacillus alkalisoli]|uniref:Metal-dependent hydrolase n=1 Tax=Lysinibacillus alkalisoli TaxID=1911548 RepID=A0A917D2U0_9BACI|nr:putative metal-dependent hydrolase [Lysinibacillus alkalisoli]GGG10225.1 putative metal-dependent hydrolase [Lysinibacillus alkalisoli]
MDVKFPIGALYVPPQVTTEDVTKWLEQIATYAGRLEETVGNLDDVALNKTYREGAWNVRQLVHHIADSQLNMYQRLKLALTEDKPTVPAFNEEKWAIQPDTMLPVYSSIQMLAGINVRIVALAQTLTPSEWQRTFIHATDGEITVASKLAKLAWHEEHHLAHIQTALQ